MYPVTAFVVKNFISPPAAYQINAVDKEIDTVFGSGFLHFGKAGAEFQIYRVVFVQTFLAPFLLQYVEKLIELGTATIGNLHGLVLDHGTFLAYQCVGYFAAKADNVGKGFLVRTIQAVSGGFGKGAVAFCAAVFRLLIRPPAA